MAADFAWIEYLSTAGDTATSTNLNLGSTLAANLAPSTYPITAGTYSYEKWIRAYFSGTFTRIENLQFWKSAGEYGTGETLKWTGQQTEWVAPTTTVSTYADTAVPTSDPGTANVSITGTTTASLVASGYSDFIILQASIGLTATAGAVAQKTFTLQYDEV